MNNQALQTNEHALPQTHSSTTDMVFDVDAMSQMQSLAQIMSSGVSTVPKHLQGNVADCMAVVMQAAQWKMNPYAVAQKTHLVSGQLGYEAQLVNAVVSTSTKIQGAFHYEWYGDWSRVIGNFITKKSQKGNEYQAPGWKAADEKGLGIRVWATLRGEDEPRVLDLLLSQAQTRNSTLWASDPKQQLAYLAVKRWARLYAPDVILGVYSSDELEPAPVRERVINPAPVETKSDAINEMLNAESTIELGELAKQLEQEMLSSGSAQAVKNVGAKAKAAFENNEISNEERSELLRCFAECMSEIKKADAELGGN